MVYIAVREVPEKFSIAHIVKLLSKVIKGNFEAINFGPTRGNTKVCYVRVSNRLDPDQVLSAVNNKTQFSAGVVNALPANLPQRKKESRVGKPPLKAKRAFLAAKFERPHVIFIAAHRELLTELQMKFTGLFNLSRKTNHKLLDEISRTIFERLKEVSDANPDALSTGFKLSSAYRRLHPHFGDFQLILSTLHRLQDASGAPRLQISESDLIQPVALPSVVENVSYDKIQSVTDKYSERISKKISEHIGKLDSDIKTEDSDEETARKKVRSELKKLNPYLPIIIREVIGNHFAPRKAPFHKVRVYGEPFLPNKDVMAGVIQRHRGVTAARANTIFNLLKFTMPIMKAQSLLALDGTVVGGAKLVVRSSVANLYSVRRPLVKEMQALFGIGDERETEGLELDDDL